MAEGPSAAVAAVSKNFGIIIAFLLPGFIAIWPAQHLSPSLGAWYCGVADPTTVCSAPTAGAFLLIALASLAAGMLISAVRWLVLDQLHERTGVARPKLDYSKLSEHLAAFDSANEDHYRYYQYYANSQVAVVTWVLLMFVAEKVEHSLALWAIVVALQVLLFLASRDALKKTDEKLIGILGTTD